MEMNGVAAAFQDHTAQIVGLQAPGRPTPVVKGMHMAEEKILQALVEEEFQPQGATAGEGEDEAGQTPAGAAQSACADSPGKAHRRRKASRRGGRRLATTQRSWLTLPV